MLLLCYTIIVIFGNTKYALTILYLVIPNMSMFFLNYNANKEGCILKPRKLKLGNKNIIGAKVYDARNAKGLKQKELLAKLQLKGVEISTPALSLLEGQKRPVSDIELKALSEILNVSVEWLLGIQDDK